MCMGKVRKGVKKMSFDKKIMQYRLDGMTYAWRYIKGEGMEAFEKELKIRNATFIQLEVDMKKVKQAVDVVVTRVFNSFITAAYKVLNEEFDFGEIRLKRFKQAFNETCSDIATLDGYGERLYTFYDYASELNKKYNLGIDLDSVEEVDRLNTTDSDKRASIKAIRELLTWNGFEDAADFLKKYLEDDKNEIQDGKS